jgi:hypothetical protein
VQSWAGDGENGPQCIFYFKFFFQLNKSTGENKNRRNNWGPQKNMKFCMKIELNICHNFYIGQFDKRSTILKQKLEISLGLGFDKNVN